MKTRYQQAQRRQFWRDLRSASYEFGPLLFAIVFFGTFLILAVATFPGFSR